MADLVQARLGLAPRFRWHPSHHTALTLLGPESPGRSSPVMANHKQREKSTHSLAQDWLTLVCPHSVGQSKSHGQTYHHRGRRGNGPTSSGRSCKVTPGGARNGSSHANNHTCFLSGSTMGRDSVEDRGRVSVTAFVAYTMPRPRKYQAVVMTDSLTGSWEC